MSIKKSKQPAVITSTETGMPSPVKKEDKGLFDSEKCGVAKNSMQFKDIKPKQGTYIFDETFKVNIMDKEDIMTFYLRDMVP